MNSVCRNMRHEQTCGSWWCRVDYPQKEFRSIAWTITGEHWEKHTTDSNKPSHLGRQPSPFHNNVHFEIVPTCGQAASYHDHNFHPWIRTTEHDTLVYLPVCLLLKKNQKDEREPCGYDSLLQSNVKFFTFCTWLARRLLPDVKWTRDWKSCRQFSSHQCKKKT